MCASATMIFEVVAQQRLAAGEAELHGAELARLAQHASQSSVVSSLRVVARSPPGCSRTRSAAGSGRSAQQQPQRRRDCGAARQCRSRCRLGHVYSSQPRRPRIGNERVHVVVEAGGVEGLLEVGDDAPTRALAVAALQDLAGAAVELHHAFRIQQHVRVLRRLPLQAEDAAAELAAERLRRRRCGVSSFMSR